MEIGIHTFGELVPDPHTHQKISAPERLKNVIRMAIMADEVGLDIFGVGEHHRLDIAASAPPVILAAIAHATKRIRLTSTVLSTADPVRVFEDFATLDVLSDGRAEIIAGFRRLRRRTMSGFQPSSLTSRINRTILTK
jgi:alkanesulfonate monooxygenase SsuD/methylene tetrahydromethanopterin reductase-like flavin-dependent oxidoreductase (luciferase family)